jgi:DNA-directed RNA polymerase subunit RPC12/RpoP
MTEFQRVDKARHRGYRWRCGACGKTFDYASRSQDGAVNARAVGPVHCPECGACDFARSAKLTMDTQPPNACWSSSEEEM